MCELTDEVIQEESFTGYKRVLIIGGRYYSPAMGIEYKEEMDLPELTPKDVSKNHTHARSNFCPPFDILSGDAFRTNMQGRTAVFLKLSDAIYSADTDEDIVKMTISKDLLAGEYTRKPVKAGKHIDKIERI
jgi:hypothetical protein